MSHRAFIAAMIAARLLPAQAPAADSSALLERAREKLVGVARRLPKYTCIETINRTYYVAPVKKTGKHLMTEAPANSCSGLEFGRNGHLSLDARDRLRLQVAVAGGSEIHSWPTASRFDNRTVFQMIPAGPVSSGNFGTYLVDIFENPGARFKFEGKEVDGRREAFEYSFRVPFNASHYMTSAGGEWKVTGYRGAFQINTATAELAWLIEETDQLPPGSTMCRAKTTVDYHYVLIGDGQFLVPRQSILETLDPNGDETTSTTTFSACHEYAAESTVRFDDHDGPATPLGNKLLAGAALPPGTSLTLALLRGIDISSAAGGDAISARVTKPVRAKDSNTVLVPAGAVARGRILQVRHQYSSSQYMLSIFFETLETQGAVSPLLVRLDRELKPAQNRNQLELRSRPTEFGLPPSATGETGSWFAFPDRSRSYVIPAGFESKWTTVGNGGLDGLLLGDRPAHK